jgi:tetratricopeptide (TPR) repeat protein
MPKAVAVVLSVLLIGLTALAAALALADIYRVEGARLVDEWSMTEERQVPPWVWEQAHRYLWLASRLAPLDPDIRNDLGRLFELRVTEQQADEPQAQADLEQALQYYRQSVALRPAWPYVWTNLAMLKVKQEQVDAEFALAMQRTATLGPWEMALQLAVAGGGLSLWARLPADLQALVEHAVAQGLWRGYRPMWSLAEQYALISPDVAGTAVAPISP